jgi:hypothetical protein
MAEHRDLPKEREPIVAPHSASPAESSRPDIPLEGEYHIYESNPVPWWIALMWISFLIFGISYLMVNLVTR